MSKPVRFQRRVHSDLEPTPNLVREFESYGFSVVNDVLKPDTCRDLAEYVDSEIGKGPIQRPFGSIVEREHRYDTPFRVAGIPREILTVTCRHPRLGGLLNSLVTPDATLVELSALTSYPGAAAQRLHTDTLFHPGDALQVCVFIALDDIEPDMGPLEILGRSSRGRPVTESSVVFPMTVGRGDAVVMDSTAAHRGSANTSGSRARRVFYFSFQSPIGNGPLRKIYSIQKQEDETFTLAQLVGRKAWSRSA